MWILPYEEAMESIAEMCDTDESVLREIARGRMAEGDVITPEQAKEILHAYELWAARRQETEA